MIKEKTPPTKKEEKTTVKEAPQLKTEKVNPALLGEIQQLQDEFTFVQTALGRIEVDYIRLGVQKDEMKAKLLELEKKETDIAKKLEKDHGQGTLDLGTGEFTKQ
jgi:predicted nuclease with TOPRIM domain